MKRLRLRREDRATQWEIEGGQRVWGSIELSRRSQQTQTDRLHSLRKKNYLWYKGQPSTGGQYLSLNQLSLLPVSNSHTLSLF